MFSICVVCSSDRAEEFLESCTRAQPFNDLRLPFVLFPLDFCIVVVAAAAVRFVGEVNADAWRVFAFAQARCSCALPERTQRARSNELLDFFGARFATAHFDIIFRRRGKRLERGCCPITSCLLAAFALTTAAAAAHHHRTCIVCCCAVYTCPLLLLFLQLLLLLLPLLLLLSPATATRTTIALRIARGGRRGRGRRGRR